MRSIGGVGRTRQNIVRPCPVGPTLSPLRSDRPPRPGRENVALASPPPSY